MLKTSCPLNNLFIDGDPCLQQPADCRRSSLPLDLCKLRLTPSCQSKPGKPYPDPVPDPLTLGTPQTVRVSPLFWGGIERENDGSFWRTLDHSGERALVGLSDDTRSCAHVGAPAHALADVCVTQTNPIRSTSIFTSSLSQLKTTPPPPPIPVSLQISPSHRTPCSGFDQNCVALEGSIRRNFVRTIQFVLFPCFLSLALLLFK